MSGQIFDFARPLNVAEWGAESSGGKHISPKRRTKGRKRANKKFFLRKAFVPAQWSRRTILL
jgi:hypothetical protein